MSEAVEQLDTAAMVRILTEAIPIMQKLGATSEYIAKILHRTVIELREEQS
ncbi:MAG: hypothetical protein WAV38_33510 [Xanthobacteraceae bacterium]